MARAKVLHKKLEVDAAGKTHKCQHNKNHVIRMGDLRLKVTEDRSHEHYCLACAAKFLSSSIEALNKLLDDVKLALPKQPHA